MQKDHIYVDNTIPIVLLLLLLEIRHIYIFITLV